MRALIILSFLLISSIATAQSKPGVYMTMDFDLDLCEHQLKLVNTEELYCPSSEPIMEFDLFEKVEEIVYDTIFEMRRFRIVLTLKGRDYISTIARKLPDHDLGLVINSVLVSVIDLDGIYYPGSIIIWDKNDSQAMEWLHRSLVKTVEKYHKKS